MNTKNISRSYVNSNYIIKESSSHDVTIISKINNLVNKLISNIKTDIQRVTIKDVYFYNNSENIELYKNNLLRQKSNF